ncbi:NUDIX hydrolase [Patescibacteria group bacterium]|nr:NUDIX hydrolase [Patescibacteria group bacterium]
MKCIIVSGPVIIERGRVLLVKEGDDQIWKFPGGKVKGGESLEKACQREVKEELGIDIKIIKPIKPLLVYRQAKTIFSITYLAKRQGKIKPSKEIKDYKWFPLTKLPEDRGENVGPVVRIYLKYEKPKPARSSSR